MDAPKSYKDPVYDVIDRQIENRVGLTPGLLSSVRLNGERSNADQVSSAGARTVYQITPPTRKAVLKKYGVDAYLSPHNAAMSAALLLKEAKDRNHGDPASAVAEYVGGTDPSNHGQVTKSYVKRVMAALNPISIATASERPEIDPNAVLSDFQQWKMSKQDAPPEEVDQPGKPEEPDNVLADFQQWKAEQQPQPPIQTPQPDSIGQPNTTPSSVMLNPYKALSMGAGVLNNALSAPNDQPVTEGDRIGQRMARDITDIGQNTINTVAHPIDTVQNAMGLIRGGVQSALPDIAVNYLDKAGISPDARQQFNGMIQGLKQSYGSPEAIQKTFHDRPVSTTLNALGLAGGVKSLLESAPKRLPAAAASIDPYTLPGTVAERSAMPNVIRSGGSAVAPLSVQAEAAGISPEITNIIRQGEPHGAINPDATARHITAQSLPVPVNLTEGQALQNGPKMSIESNSRAKYPELGDRFDQQDAALHANLDLSLS